MKKRYIIGGVIIAGLVVGNMVDEEEAAEPVEQVEEVEAAAPEEQPKEEEKDEKEPKEEAKQEAKKEDKPKGEKKEEKKDNTAAIEYNDTMSDFMTRYADETGEMSELLINAGNDPYLMFEDDWIMDMAVTLTTMDALLDDIEAVEPPKEMEQIHGHIMDFVTDARFVTNNMPDAIDNMDIDLMDEITDKIYSGSDHLDKATVAIEEKTAELQ